LDVIASGAFGSSALDDANSPSRAQRFSHAVLAAASGGSDGDPQEPPAMIWLVVVLGLSLLVFLHELGHFWAARLLGIKPRAFYIGFPLEIPT
jgi:Peptidase family M50